MRMKENAGFTLLEVMISLTILAVGIVAVMQLFPISLRQSRVAAERTVVASLAKTELGKVKAGGVGTQLQEWARSNAFRTLSEIEQGYALYQGWRTTVQRVPGASAGNVDLYRVTFAVQMLDGREETFVTYVTDP